MYSVRKDEVNVEPMKDVKTDIVVYHMNSTTLIAVSGAELSMSRDVLRRNDKMGSLMLDVEAASKRRNNRFMNSVSSTISWADMGNISNSRLL